MAHLPAIRRREEISEANVSQLIFIHCRGSFGHLLAKQYSIKEGYCGEGIPFLGFSKTQEAMILNKFAIDALIECNIPAVTISRSLLYSCEV